MHCGVRGRTARALQHRFLINLLSHTQHGEGQMASRFKKAHRGALRRQRPQQVLKLVALQVAQRRVLVLRRAIRSIMIFR